MMPIDPVMTEPNPGSSVDLLIKAQAGDAEALNGLLSRYLPRLRRWASGRLPGGLRSMLDTGDLVQDAMINALRNLSALEIRTDASLLIYLRRAVQNRIIDLYRRSGRRPGREELSDDIAGHGPSPLALAISAETVEWYERALANLTDEEQDVIFMSLELGFGPKEIAEHLGKPSADAARMAVNRAVDRLAAEMQRIR
jgi:RNA polymerase sigma factor (sigma-70 family)